MSKWYAWSTKYQKDIRYLIRIEQQGAKLHFGPFGIINREMFKLVSIYCVLKPIKIIK